MRAGAVSSTPPQRKIKIDKQAPEIENGGAYNLILSVNG
jgi:hypothetical protein